ncbi:transcriptional regulator [Streptomyces fumigatiscleroticus]|nr:transcriptional regulator [Streptomyces fumigatiscleroticus]
MPSTYRETLVAEAVLDLSVRTYDCDVLDTLHDLTAYAVTLLGIRAAGTTIVDEAGRVNYLTASDEVCRQLEEDQLDLDEGPCLDSTRSGTVLPPVTLRPPGPGRQRWPRFTSRALRVGITCVAAVPLRTDGHAVGAVNLMCAGSSVPSEQDLRLAQVLADAAGVWLRQRQILRTRDEIAEQLEAACDTRLVIEEAKGVLMARLGIDVDEALLRLRSYARARRQSLGELAARVTGGTVPTGLDAPP